MAAFLNEIKTAKLRKVGSVQGLSRSHSDMGKAPGGRPSGLPRRASAGGLVHQSGLSTTLAQLARTGAKRKRSELGDLTRREAPGVFIVPTSSPLSFIHYSPAAKRRSPAASKSTDVSISRDHSTSLSRSYPPPPPSSIHAGNRTWPSISITTETDITTPSLCSDNDVERPDDTHPATPPDTQPVRERPMKPPPPKEVIDVDMEDNADVHTVTGPRRPRLNALPSSSSSAAPVAAAAPQTPPRINDILAKRPPTSPMPNPSPRKPRPPARATSRKSIPAYEAPHPRDEGELPRMTSSAVAGPSKPANTVTAARPRSQTGSSRRQESSPARSVSRESERPSKNSSRPPQRRTRRPTLDEELRHAGEELDADLDSGVLVGVGTRDKRGGFLAHGGAGGIPVFMGVGYVQGAMDGAEEEHDRSEEEDDDDYYEQPRRRRISTRRRVWRSADSGHDS